MLQLILLVFAFVLVLIESCWDFLFTPIVKRPHLGWLGVAIYFLSLLLGHA
jgi:hypothetical protein